MQVLTYEVDCTHLLIQISLGVFVHHKQEMTSFYVCTCTTVPLYYIINSVSLTSLGIIEKDFSMLTVFDCDLADTG